MNIKKILIARNEQKHSSFGKIIEKEKIANQESKVSTANEQQSTTKKCVFFLLMAFQATTEVNRLKCTRDAFALISSLPSTSYLLRALIYYFKIRFRKRICVCT